MPLPLPHACPICGQLTIRRLFEDVRITAELDHELRNVGGLAAFMCTQQDHIFFVLRKDLDQRLSASSRL